MVIRAMSKHINMIQIGTLRAKKLTISCSNTLGFAKSNQFFHYLQFNGKLVKDISDQKMLNFLF